MKFYECQKQNFNNMFYLNLMKESAAKLLEKFQLPAPNKTNRNEKVKN